MLAVLFTLFLVLSNASGGSGAGGNPTCEQDPPVCSTNDILKQNQASITCSGSRCTAGECCEARTCCSGSAPFDQSDVACTAGRKTKTGVCGLACGASCDESDCCADTCESWSRINVCTTGTTKAGNAADLLCTDGPGGFCNASFCCESTPVATCDSPAVDCGALTRKDGIIECASQSGCTVDECCDDTCKNNFDNNGLSCGTNQIQRRNPELIRCGGDLAACDASTCCVSNAPCTDPCDPLTCDEVACASQDDGADTCPKWTNKNARSGSAPITKSRPSLCDVGSDTWIIYPHEHNCGCKVAHANGCNQCREGFFQIDREFPCLCCSVIPNCAQCHDGRGCDVCATGYATVECPLWRGYNGNEAGTYTISVCSDATEGVDENGNDIPAPNCEQWYNSYDETCNGGVDTSPCFDDSWPVTTRRLRREFEDCTDDQVDCAPGLTCEAVNTWYKQCKGSTTDCPSDSVEISPPGLANESPSTIELTAWYTRAGECAKIQCSQAGNYKGTVNICCGNDNSTLFEEWTSAGSWDDCEPDVTCAGNNVTFTDSEGNSQTVAGWYSHGNAELTVPCGNGLNGVVTLTCPKDSSVNPTGTLVYKEDNCKTSCYAGGDCTTTDDCCGNLVCKDYGQGSKSCQQPAPTCTLGDTSGIANIGDTSGCTGTIRDDECVIGCAAGNVAVGCVQCLITGGEFSLRNFKCVAEESPGVPSKPVCECNSFSNAGNSDRSAFMCQGPAYAIGVGQDNVNTNQNHTEMQVCYDRPPVTQLLNEGTDDEKASGRCGEASGLGITWGQDQCQLAYECVLPVTCETQKKGDGSNYWDDGKCQEAGGDSSFIAKSALGSRGCGMVEGDCDVNLCCEQVLCESWWAVNPDTNLAANSCGAGTFGVNGKRPCEEGECSADKCCGRTCEGITCSATGLTNPTNHKNYHCFDNVDASDPDSCQNRCCVATCASATAQAGFCDAPFAGMTASSSQTVLQTVCSSHNYTTCDPLLCCQHALCSDVFASDAGFCTSAGLTDVAFVHSPCGATVGDCTTAQCCRATCGDFCSDGEASRVGDGEDTAKCYWPADADLTNSSYAIRSNDVKCRNSNVECGLTIESCSMSTCCQTYYPEFPKQSGNSPDSTFQGHGNEPYIPRDDNE